MEAEITIKTIVFIVTLIVPGIFFKRFYFRGQFTKQFSAGLFADRLITSIFWGLMVQIITFLILNKSVDLSYNEIKDSVSRWYSRLAANSLPDLTTQDLMNLLGYLIASIVIAAFLGCFAHGIVRFFKIDSKFEVFRFTNHWNYYFRGDSMDFAEFKPNKRGKILSTLVDVVMENGEGKTKMFSGFITQYHISSETGQLETLYLTDAKRYSNSNSAFRAIDGDCLVIPYSRVIDMNIRYNVRVINSDIYKKIIQASISTISGAYFFFILIYPWFWEISYWRILIGIFTAITSGIFIIALIDNILKLPGHNNTLTGKGIVVMVGIIIVLSFISLLALGLII